MSQAVFSGGNASPATVMYLSEGSGPVGFQRSKGSSSPSVGCEGWYGVRSEDAQASPVPSTLGKDAGEAIPPPWVEGKLRDSSGQ